MSTLKANTNKPWMTDEYNIPVIENEETWSQRVIDDAAKNTWLDIDKEKNVNEEKYNQNDA